MSKVTVTLPEYWTAHEARAVFELLDELKERIGAVYGRQIIELCRAEHEQGIYQVTKTDPGDINDEQPF